MYIYYFVFAGGVCIVQLSLNNAGDYFSNGSSLPPRLPGLSLVLKGLQASSSTSNAPIYTIVALSYRGFWTSRGRPSERGIALDAAAALDWVSQRFPQDSKLVLWGQSLGAGVAANAVAARIRDRRSGKSEAVVPLREETKGLKVSGLVMETPFTSIRAMLVAIYPQKWLPYRYLYPFLWNQWDSRQALFRVSESNVKPLVLILPAGRDDLVPKSHAAELENVCKDGGIDVRRLMVKGALHHEVLSKHEGRQAVVSFLRSIAEKG